jgi:tellurium resistance protein TerD
MSTRSGISLKKDERKELEKKMRHVMVGCGWDANPIVNDKRFDLDLACFLLDANGKMAQESHFIFYGNQRYKNWRGVSVVVHTGDNLTGDGEGDDERLLIDLEAVPSTVACIEIYCAIYEAEARGQTFGAVSNCYMRLVDTTGEQNRDVGGPLYDLTSYAEIDCCYVALDDCAVLADCILFGRLERTAEDQWWFRAVCKSMPGGFDAVLRRTEPDHSLSAGILSLVPNYNSNSLSLIPTQAATLVRENKTTMLAMAVGYLLFNVGFFQLLMIGGVFYAITRRQ